MITKPLLDFLDAEHKEITKLIESTEGDILKMKAGRRDLSKAIDALVFKSAADSVAEAVALGGGILGGYAARATESTKSRGSDFDVDTPSKSITGTNDDLKAIRGIPVISYSNGKYRNSFPVIKDIDNIYYDILEKLSTIKEINQLTKIQQLLHKGIHPTKSNKQVAIEVIEEEINNMQAWAEPTNKYLNHLAVVHSLLTDKK